MVQPKGSLIFIAPGHDGWIQSLSFSHDGYLLASAGDDDTVRLWDVETGNCLKTLDGHTDTVCYCAFHPSGALIAAGASVVKLPQLIQPKESLTSSTEPKPAPHKLLGEEILNKNPEDGERELTRPISAKYSSAMKRRVDRPKTAPVKPEELDGVSKVPYWLSTSFQSL